MKKKERLFLVIKLGDIINEIQSLKDIKKVYAKQLNFKMVSSINNRIETLVKLLKNNHRNTITLTEYQEVHLRRIEDDKIKKKNQRFRM